MKNVTKVTSAVEYYVKYNEEHNEWDVRERAATHDICCDSCDDKDDAELSAKMLRVAHEKAKAGK